MNLAVSSTTLQPDIVYVMHLLDIKDHVVASITAESPDYLVSLKSVDLSPFVRNFQLASFS